jgi:peptide/nickel transport system substrate-binding protein
VLLDGYKREFVTGNAGGFLMQLAGVPDLDHVRAPDDQTLEFVFTSGEPGPLFQQIQTLINMSILSPAQVAQHGNHSDPWAQTYFKQNPPAGSGPYMYSSYQPGDHAVLKANPRYYGTKPALRTIIQNVVTDPTQRALLLERGDVDMVFHPAVQDLAALKKSPGVKVVSIPSPRQYLFEMNNAIAPFDKVEVRQAISYAIPYDSIIKDVWLGHATSMQSYIPAGMPGSDFSFWKYNTDMNKAAQLLAAAGYPKGQGAPPIKITVAVGTAEDTLTAEVIQSALSQLGLRVSVQQLSLGTYTTLRESKQLQCDVFNSLWFVNDPWFAIWGEFSSQSPDNFLTYKNPQIDAGCEQWMRSADTAGRLAAARQAQEVILNDAPVACLCSPNWNVLLRDNVRGYIRYPDELTRYAWMRKIA